MADRAVRVRLSAENSAFMRGMRESGQAVNRLQRDISALDRELRRLDGRTIKVRAELDSSALQGELRRIEAGTSRLSVAIHGQLDETELQSQLDTMRLSVRVRTRVDNPGPLPDRNGGSAGGSGGGGGGGGAGGFLVKAAAVGIGVLTPLIPQTISLLSAATAATVALAGQIGVASVAGVGFVPVLGSMGQAAGAFALAGQDVAGALEAQAKAADLAVEGGEPYEKALAKYQARLKALAPEQRKFVEQVDTSRKAVVKASAAAGEQLFAGLGDSLRDATTRLLPLLAANLTETATLLNRTGRSAVTELAGPLRDDLADALTLNNDLLRRASPLVNDLATVAIKLYNAAGPLAVRFVEAATGLASMAESATVAGVESGKVGEFFDRAGDKAFALGRILKDTGLGLLSVLNIGGESANTLRSLETLASRFRDFTQDIDSRASLRTWFMQGERAAEEFGLLLGDIKREFAGVTDGAGPQEIIGVFRQLTPALADFIKGVSRGGQAFRDLIEIVSVFGGGTLTALEHLIALAATIGRVVTAVPGMSAVVSAAVVALAGFKIYGLASGPVGRVAVQFAAATTAVYRFVAGVGILVGQVGVINAVRFAVANLSLAWGALGTAARLGVLGAVVAGMSAVAVAGVDRLIAAFRDGATSADEFYAALQQAGRGDATRIQSQLADLDRAITTLGDNAPTAGNQVRGFFKSLVDLNPFDTAAQVEDFKEKVSNLDEAFARLVNGGHADLAVQQFAQVEDIARRLGIPMDELTRLFPEYGRALDGIGGKSAAAAIGLGRYKDQAAALQRATDDAAAATQRLIDKFTTLNEGALSRERAAQNLRTAQDSLTESVKENGRVLDRNSTKGQANRAALLDLVEASNDAATAEFKHNVETKGLARAQEIAEKAVGKQRDALIAQAKQAGLSRTAARKLIDTILLTPEEVATRFATPGLESATNHVADLGRAINNLPRNVAVKLGLNTSFRSGITEADGGIVSYYARGGIAEAERYANGGMRESHVAQIAPAGAMRVWAEPETGGEAYIPLSRAKRARSVAIWEETGRRLEQFREGGIRSNSVTIKGTERGTEHAIAGFGSALRSRMKGIRESLLGDILGAASPSGRGGLGPRAAAARLAVMDRFGISNIGGYSYRNIAGTNVLSKHAIGKAIDVMTGSASVRAAVASFFVRNAGQYGVDNVIRDRMIWNRPRGWHRYTGQNPHTDHTHIDFYAKGGLLNPHVRDNGGPLQPGYTFNGTGKQEFVVPPQWVQGSRLPAPAMAAPGGGTQRVEHDVTVRHESVSEVAVAVSRRIQTDMRDELAVSGSLL